MTIAMTVGEARGEGRLARNLTPLDSLAPSPGVPWLGYDGPLASGSAGTGVRVVCESPDGVSAEDVARAYRAGRDGMGRRLEGSYSFILHDEAEQSVWTASDLTSRAPLAYWAKGVELAVSSRVLDLLGHPGVSRSLDEAYLAHVATGLWSPAPGSTAFQHVKRLLPGVALWFRRGILELRTIDRLRPVQLQEGADKAAWIDALWRALDLATGRLRGDASASLALSGGLDSAVLAASLVRDRPTPLAAFSMTIGEVPGEGAALQAVRRALPASLLARTVDARGCTDLAALDSLDLPDDPQMSPLAILPARTRLWSAVRAEGFRTIVEGEGADELFDMLHGPRQAIAEGQWLSALRYVRASPARRMLVARSMLLPALPSRVGHAWSRWQAKRTPILPSFLTRQALEEPRILQACEDFYRGQIDGDFPAEVLRWLSAPAIVGTASSHRTLARALGLSLRTPMLDRRVIEVALGVPAEHLLSPRHKAFLRDAASTRLPASVTARSKDIATSEGSFRAILGSERVRAALADRRVRERLERWVRFERLAGMIDEVRGGHELPLSLWQQIEGMVAFAYWYSRASREHGVV